MWRVFAHGFLWSFCWGLIAVVCTCTRKVWTIARHNFSSYQYWTRCSFRAFICRSHTTKVTLCGWFASFCWLGWTVNGWIRSSISGKFIILTRCLSFIKIKSGSEMKWWAWKLNGVKILPADWLDCSFGPLIVTSLRSSQIRKTLSSKNDDRT